jgi:hypothetical protein
MWRLTDEFPLVREQEKIMRVPTIDSVTATITAGLCLAIPALIGLSGGEPTVLGPFPVLTMLPAFFVRSGAVVVPILLFFAWNPGLFRGQEKVPKRSYWLLGTVIALSPMWFALSWTWGLHYQGARYTYTVCAGNVVWASLLVGLFVGFRNREASFRTNLLLNWALFAWLAWYAFPFLGELL